MHKAILTESGAKRIGHPELAGKEVEFDKYSKDHFGVPEGRGGAGRTVENVYHNGRRIARFLSYAGGKPGLDIRCLN